MRVHDLMEAEVATLEATDRLDLADDVMRLGRIRHLPVLRAGKLVGVISQRDLFRAGLSSVLAFRPTAEREWLAKITVQEILDYEPRPLITVRPETDMREAVQLILREKIGCLPVVNAAGELVGLLSETDCLRWLDRMLASGEAGASRPEPPPGA